MKKCFYCGELTNNHKFCSRSCAASFNNRKKPKRKPEHKCVDCGKCINASRARCKEHYLSWLKNKEPTDMSLKEAIYNKHHRSSAYALVRSRARMIAKKNNLLNKCIACGYSKHVEIAHIKSISLYNENTMISEINSINNLIPLCPNCHWEFDNNLLEFKL